MVIRSSAARDVRQLVDELRHGDPVRRETAIARLRVLGGRSVAQLSALVRTDPSASTRAAGMKALDGIDDARVPTLALAALQDADAEVRIAALGALRGWIGREDGTRILDAAAGLALDRQENPAVRQAAREVLLQLPQDLVQPILDAALPDEGDDAELDEPAAATAWLASHADAPLSSLHALVMRTRAREAAEANPLRRTEWRAARGAVHVALARRGSRVALYDLRETFERADAPLPIDFLVAAAEAGDATCLEPMARAWSHADDPWWREHVAEAAGAIVTRLGLTGRHAAVKRVRAKWAGFLD